MSIEKMGGGSPEKEPREEYHVLNEKGESVEVMQLPEGIGDEFYVEVLSDGEQKLLPYKKLIKGVVDHAEGVVNWSDGLKTEYIGDEDVVFAEGEEKVADERKIIPEKNVKVGKVSKSDKTISYE